MTKTAPLPMPAFWCVKHQTPLFAYQDVKRHWDCPCEIIRAPKEDE